MYGWAGKSNESYQYKGEKLKGESESVLAEAKTKFRTDSSRVSQKANLGRDLEKFFRGK
jgi:hypothetical protein